MNCDIRSALEGIRRYRPLSWDLIPDLGLYMDQVGTFITRMYEPLYGEAVYSYLSPSMINNYVKAALIPRPVGKKYSREQIALLTMIVALKQVASMEDIRIMITPPDGMTLEKLYTLFCARQHSVISALVDVEENENCELPPAMNFAIISSGYRSGFEAMLKASVHQ